MSRLNADCAQGKHAACSGTAWDYERDELTDCACPCHVPVKQILDDIADRADQAAEGPWTNEAKDFAYVRSDHGDAAIGCGIRADQNAAFIAAARTDVPRLVAALRSVMKQHQPEWVYDLADECGCDPDAPGYDERHPESDEGDPICLDSPHHQACRGCEEACNTGAADAPMWPCPTVRAIEFALRGSA